MSIQMRMEPINFLTFYLEVEVINCGRGLEATVVVDLESACLI